MATRLRCKAGPSCFWPAHSSIFLMYTHAVFVDSRSNQGRTDMSFISRHKRRRVVLFAALALSIVACGDRDARSKRVVVGMPKDSVMRIIQSAPDGSPPRAGEDPNANIWRVAAYLVQSKWIEVIYYSAANERWVASDTVPEKRVFPIVLIDGKVAGAGYGDYDKLAAQYTLPKVRF